MMEAITSHSHETFFLREKSLHLFLLLKLKILQSNQHPIDLLLFKFHSHQPLHLSSTQSTSNKSLSQTKQIHRHMIVSIFPCIALGNKLVDSCLKSREIDNARRMFDELPQPHIVSGNSMIPSYTFVIKGREAISLFKEMIPKGTLPYDFTFFSIFKAYCELVLNGEGRGTHRLLVVLDLDAKNAFVGSSLVDIYAKSGRLGDAQKVYERIKDKDVFCSTALIVGFSQNGMDREAIRIFGDMVNLGVKANGFTFF